MTEQEWLTSTDPQAMLRSLQRVWDKGETYYVVTDRKLWLFACACARQVWHLLTDERSKAAVVAAEQHADHLITDDDLAAASAADSAAASAADSAAASAADSAAARAAASTAAWAAARAAASSAQGAFLRDIVGNPFRFVTLDPAWLTPTVLSLAQAAYEERQPDGTLDPVRLAILSDALEEAGCVGEQCPECGGSGLFGQDHPFGDTWVTEWLSCHGCEAQGRLPSPILAHLRSDSPHVRGCHVLDLILGKE